MRFTRLLLALLVLLPTGASAADTQGTALPVYRAELVLFLRDTHPDEESWPNDPGAPDPARAIAVLPLDPEQPATSLPTPVTPLPVTDHQLTAQAEALSRKSLTPLLHLAWQQPVGERDNGDWIWIDAGPITGLVRIGLGRFLHIDTDLALRDGDGEDARVIRSIDHRRMRSAELHYLDHPAFGILVRVDPVEETSPADPREQRLPESSD